MANKKHTTEYCACGIATIGRFYETDNGGSRVGDPIKVQMIGDVFPPHIRILRENDGLLACVMLDKAEYLPCKWHNRNLTDEQINGLIDFFRSPSDFPLVRLDGVPYKLKTMWDYTIVSWNRESDDARLRFALQRDNDDYLILQMPDYTKLNQGSALKKISRSDIDTYELTRAAKEDTGLNYDLMLDSVGKDRHGVPPHIFVCVGDELIPLLLSSNNNDPDGFADVRKYIRAYLSVLLAHYNKLLTDRQTLNLLRGIEMADDELVDSTLSKVGAEFKTYD